MGIRNRDGKWHYRFMVDGHEYSGNTGLAATKRNRGAALREEAKARELVLNGRERELRLEAKPFNRAAEDFLEWARGEHRGSPATVKRLETSFASLVEFFRKQPVSSILPGHVERYKSHRRLVHRVKDVTLRHDLHALSKAYRYWISLNWARENPVSGVDIPGDRDAVREHILSCSEEKIYFDYVSARYPDLYDFGRLILNLGMRPWEELICLRKENVDLERGFLRVVDSKSRAGRRTLRLTREAREILSRRMKTPGPWIFPSDRKPGRHYVKLTASHEKALAATGLSFVLYDLRHTCATRWAEAGMPPAVLAANLGHADLRTIMRYVHVRPEAAHRAIEEYDSRRIDTDEIRTKKVISGSSMMNPKGIQ